MDSDWCFVKMSIKYFNELYYCSIILDSFKKKKGYFQTELQFLFQVKSFILFI